MNPRIKLIAAFAAVYTIWGSTYLGIRLAVATIPPFMMAGTRFLVAGAALYIWARLRGAPKPTMAHWKSASIIGTLLLFVGNGWVSWAEQFVPSGITALIISSSPLWFVGLDWWHRGTKPTASVIAGVVMGTVGILVLIDPANLVGGQQIDLVGAAVLIVAEIAWVWGSLYSRQAETSPSPLLGTAMQMLAGAVVTLAVSAIVGEPLHADFSQMTVESLSALGYLIVFGSLIAFSSYIWLLQVAPPALVSTYAYVNPIIAVFLGWLIADEPLGPRVLLSAAIIVGAVATITTLGTTMKSEGRRVKS